MDKFMLFKRSFDSLFLLVFAVFTPSAWAEGEGLVIDVRTGQYKDLSYDSLSDKGLTWKAVSYTHLTLPTKS